MLDREEEMTCTRVFPSCEKLFEVLEKEAHPDLLLMDLGLPSCRSYPRGMWMLMIYPIIAKIRIATDCRIPMKPSPRMRIAMAPNP
jgi:CheY-like chemotaxis protein